SEQSDNPPCLSTIFPSLPPRTLSSTLFPYTTLFRSGLQWCGLRNRARHAACGAARVRIDACDLQPSPRRRRGARGSATDCDFMRSEEHTTALQSRFDLVCCLLLEKINILRDGYTACS